MTVRRHNPPTVHSPAGRYSHVTVHPLGNGLKRVVLAGQVGVKPDGAIAGDLRRSSRPGTICSRASPQRSSGRSIW
jgi:hypothetical protein